ncbi:uncharacterized protein MONBRDRAFT_29656 [Monosiga brevicollis MX1]|uniref:SLC41A/MgtE integral membrane domain-containing protein n=1 Tax=Monosiga brevicollis TaxID=81824 RepID=A9VBR3_MONBE|nr:uncharacterized protein MONBRDRAFT_29656 [Monosiga brevicollis MX1]EDQ84978.1 predicted protein [Monosiga brevicollis MX1]|eukprot:XP_001750148.1 hypothetical protein [Monosiga brevicollis MX1]
MIKANLMLIQCQAIVVAIAAAMLSIVMGVVVHAEFSVHDSAVILTSAIVTASLASLLLGSLMAVIVVLSRQLSIDPDNVATPLAAALGDLVTLAILAGIGTFLLSLGSYTVVVALIFCIVFVGGLFPYALTAPQYKQVGYPPPYIPKFSSFRHNPPVLFCHGSAMQGSFFLPPSSLPGACHSDSHNRAGLLLFAMVLPVSYVFLGLIEVTHLGHTSITPLFMTGYSFAALTQVCILLLIVGRLVKFIWHKNMDPDQVSRTFALAASCTVGRGPEVEGLEVL